MADLGGSTGSSAKKRLLTHHRSYCHSVADTLSTKKAGEASDTVPVAVIPSNRGVIVFAEEKGSPSSSENIRRRARNRMGVQAGRRLFMMQVAAGWGRDGSDSAV